MLDVFCAARKRWLITTSPVKSTRSSSTKIIVSPRVCIAAGPRHNRRTCTPPRSSRYSRSNRMSGVGYSDAAQQLRGDRRAAGERVLNLLPELRHVLLLHARHQQLRALERRGAERVLGVVMRRHDVHVGVRADLLHLADDRLAVPAAQPRVDHERRLAADDDADVGHEADVEIGDRPDMLGELHRGVLPDERRGRGSLAGRLLRRCKGDKTCERQHESAHTQSLIHCWTDGAGSVTLSA